MTPEDFVTALDPNGLTIRYFADKPGPGGGGNSNGRPKWRAALSAHYYISNGMRGPALFDSDDRADSEGWGDTPGAAVEDLSRALVEAHRNRARRLLDGHREQDAAADALATKLGLSPAEAQTR